jgi:hypothetical protein
MKALQPRIRAHTPIPSNTFSLPSSCLIGEILMLKGLKD